MKIGLFIPCYVDVVYPQVGVATYKLLKHLGLDVDYPLNQTCCGQPMANAGFEQKAVPLAEEFEDKFKGFDYIVAPSVSCRPVGQLHGFRQAELSPSAERQARVYHLQQDHGRRGVPARCGEGEPAPG